MGRWARFGVGCAGLLSMGLLWRRAARRGLVARPGWLAWSLEGPGVRRVAGAGLLVERLGVEPGMRVLDIGSGAGRVTLAAARAVGPEGEVVALDQRRAALEQLRDTALRLELRNVRLVHGTIGEGRLGAASFDRALLVLVLGEVANREVALAELFRALKPGGILSVTEIAPDPCFQSREEVRRYAAAAGFEEAAEFGGKLAYTLNFCRPAEAPQPS